MLMEETEQTMSDFHNQLFLMKKANNIHEGNHWTLLERGRKDDTYVLFEQMTISIAKTRFPNASIVLQERVSQSLLRRRIHFDSRRSERRLSSSNRPITPVIGAATLDSSIGIPSPKMPESFGLSTSSSCPYCFRPASMRKSASNFLEAQWQ